MVLAKDGFFGEVCRFLTVAVVVGDGEDFNQTAEIEKWQFVVAQNRFGQQQGRVVFFSNRSTRWAKRRRLVVSNKSDESA